MTRERAGRLQFTMAWPHPNPSQTGYARLPQGVVTQILAVLSA